MTLIDVARDWLEEDPDPETREELGTLIEAADFGEEKAIADLQDRFAATLQFGTAGLRGALGAGPNRMNRVVVIRAAAGLAAYLNTNGNHGGKVVIGYDARRNSDVFAEDTAAVMAGAGLQPLLLPRPLPTPVLAFAIRQLGCVAGVMVTASHNPPQDNGYKVYLGNGSQIVPPADTEISAAIDAVGPLDSVVRKNEKQVLDEEIVRSYSDRVVSTIAADGPRDLSIVYTPMHGVGGSVVTDVLARAGFAAPAVVAEQAEPDPAFPTVAFPNPEEPGALDLSFALAESVKADIILANDPDADRCAVAIPDRDGSWRRLTGDEVGGLLAMHLLESGVKGTFATSIVSSSLLSSIAARYEQPYAETLTGFKWLGRIPGLAFGYEEALGYCVDPGAVGDKDGISALLRIVELAALLKSHDRSLLDGLDAIAREYGVHATSQLSVRVSDISETTAIVGKLLDSPPASLGGRAIERIDDLATPGGELPPTEGVRFMLADHARVIVRPSGTEPKLKCYLEVIEPPTNDVEPARARAAESMAAIRTDITALIS